MTWMVYARVRDALVEQDAAGRDRINHITYEVAILEALHEQLLAQPHWQGKFTPRDYIALTPLIWEHVNSYGRFDLDMNTRLALL
jgi:hypothetical protein